MLQVDSGKYLLVTNNIYLLHNLRQIKSQYIGGIGSGIMCTAFGNYYINKNNVIGIKVPMLYSLQSSETVVCLQDICDAHKYYLIFTKEFDTTTKGKTLTF